MESRIQATDRLRLEGRWDAACRFRDETKRRLQAEGQTRKEANEQAWQAMIAEFPPLPADEPLDYADDDLPADDGSTLDLARDAGWVYANLVNKVARPHDAPSRGAWGLLTWARQNRNRFYECLLPRFASRPTEQEPQDELESPTTVEEIMSRYIPNRCENHDGAGPGEAVDH
ncbi:MAG: hypothetical protein FJ276_20350 [Planctomycetes bacterium]|nr:hypothetical protein [Planctomycetota bacterium]